MSMFENDQYRWRETYFVLFSAANRPSVQAMEKTLTGLNAHFTLANASLDESGRLESISVLSPEDFAAVDICYVEGEEVLEQVAEMADELEAAGCQAGELAKLERLRACDARFDVLHFEQVLELEDGGPDEMLDPSALLVVLEALAGLTGGVAIDPQSGALM